MTVATDGPVGDPWNPDQYAKFLREREQPFYDLLAMIARRPGMRVVDLGCGTGRLTRALHERLDARETVGIDRSARMLASAREAGEAAGLRFEQEPIEQFPAGGERYDLVFSNAALHWVDDHERLFARLASALTPGGQLAVQVPAMHDTETHTIAAELNRQEPYRTAAHGWERAQPVLSPIQYARLLFHLGFRDPAVRVIVYPHLLPSADDAVEWMKGTLLAEYSRHLPPEIYQQFVADYRARWLAHAGAERPFFFPFKRILIWGERA